MGFTMIMQTTGWVAQGIPRWWSSMCGALCSVGWCQMPILETLLEQEASSFQSLVGHLDFEAAV